jgi:hypothetical protein
MFELTKKKDNFTYLPININDPDTNNFSDNNSYPHNNRNIQNGQIDWEKYGILTYIIFLSIVILSFFSLNYVSYEQYAFAHNVFTSVDTSRVYEQGTYFKLPWIKFEYFPSTYQYVNLYEPVFSDTGLEFDLRVIFYYRLEKERLGSIYNLFSKDYHGRILSNSKQIIKNIGSKYSVDDYVLNRFVIERDIGMSLSGQLNEEIGIEINPNFVKITDINFPDNVVQTNLMSAIAQQQNNVEINEQNYQAVLSETNYLVSQLNSQAEQVLEFSTNQANLMIANTDSLSQNIIGKAKLSGIDNFFKSLNITNSDTKTKFINWFGINDNQNSTLVFGFDTSNVFIK